MSHDRQRIDSALEGHYKDLKRLAQHHLGRLPPGQTLNATALVHEAFLKVAHRYAGDPPSEAELVTLLSYAIRDVLVTHLRSKMRMKRREDAYRQIQETLLADDDGELGERLLELDAALRRLEELKPDLAELVTLHVFGEIKLERIAELKELSYRTVKRRWRAAKAWIQDSMRSEPISSEP